MHRAGDVTAPNFLTLVVFLISYTPQVDTLIYFSKFECPTFLIKLSVTLYTTARLVCKIMSHFRQHLRHVKCSQSVTSIHFTHGKAVSIE